MTVEALVPGLSNKLEQRLLRGLRGAVTRGRVVLFGSRAKGTQHSGSDLDLALQDTDFPPSELAWLKDFLEAAVFPYGVDVVIDDEKLCAPLREHIARVGKVIYQAPE